MRDFLIAPIAQYYEEQLPFSSKEMKDCEAMLQATLARKEKMAFDALVKMGVSMNFGSTSAGFSFAGAEKHFEHKEIAPKDSPKFKMQELRMINAATHNHDAGVASDGKQG